MYSAVAGFIQLDVYFSAVTPTFELNHSKVRMNQHVKYLGQKHFILKLLSGQRETQTDLYSAPIALIGPPKWLVTINLKACVFYVFVKRLTE